MKVPRILLLASLTAFLPAQEAPEIKARGGGELKIGPASYQFSLDSLSTAPPKGGLPGAVKFTGSLASPDGSFAFHMELTVLKDGRLYLLVIQRQNSQSYRDSWSATQKTRTRFLKLEDRLGGRIEVRCEGSLKGFISGKASQALWSGTLWAVQPGGPDPAENQNGS